MYQRRGARPACYWSCRWPVGLPHGRSAKGQKGQEVLVAGHPRLVASHVCTTQPCGQKLEKVNQEREKATFRRGSKGSIRITGRPRDIGGLLGVYNTNMWFGARKSGLSVVNIGFQVGKTGDGGRWRNKTGCQNNYWPPTLLRPF